MYRFSSDMLENRFKARHWYGIALVIFCAALSEVTLSAPCTPATCPKGPVLVTFENEGCTGRPSYESIPREWGVCTSLGSFSSGWTFTDKYMEYGFYSDPSCGKSDEYPNYTGERMYFGNCFDESPFPSATSKHLLGKQPSLPGMVRQGKRNMYLGSVNQTFESPQFPVVNPHMPLSKVSTIPCNSIEDCSSKGLFFEAAFRQNCNEAYWFSGAWNISANACLQTEKYVFQSWGCVDKHTMEIRTSQNSDCSHPHTSSVHGQKCNGRNSVNTIICGAKPSSEIQRKQFKIFKHA